MSEHIVAVFETEAAATAAIRSLENLGIPASAIRQYSGRELSETQDTPVEHTTTTHSSEGGFWSWLFGDEATSETTQSYGDDIYDRRTAAGNVIISVWVEDAMIDQTIDALDAHHPLDIDEHTTGAGALETPASVAPMTGPSTTCKEFSSGELARAGVTGATPPASRVGVSSATAVTPAVEPVTSSASSAGLPASGSATEEVIPLSEEELQVGKRTVDRGTTRIHRYVVEKPVEQNVSLQSEKVTVERRQPIETATPGTGAFEERVVEVRETAEEPVVSKIAHVAEEVVVGREATERTETVRDTVRREEVEISGDGTVKR
jgi:uncharacterized protein (TIGR02271 family)